MITLLQKNDQSELEACSTAPIVAISAVFSCYNNPLFGGGQGVRELQDEGKSLVIASEAKQSAVCLLQLFRIKDQRQAAAPPCRDSKVPAIPVTGARSDGSVTRHSERSEAIRLQSFSISNLQLLGMYKGSKAGCRAPCWHSKVPAICVTGARSDASVICHCERSEAICSLSFCFYPRQENKGRLPRPLIVIQ